MDYNSSSSAAERLFAGGILAVLGVWLFVIMAIVVLVVIAQWKLFKRAGVEGWKSIVPLLNVWEMIKIAFGETNPLLFLAMFVPIVNGIAGIYITYKFASAYTESELMAVLYVVFPFIVPLIFAFKPDKYQYRGAQPGIKDDINSIR